MERGENSESVYTGCSYKRWLDAFSMYNGRNFRGERASGEVPLPSLTVCLLRAAKGARTMFLFHNKGTRRNYSETLEWCPYTVFPKLL